MHPSGYNVSEIGINFHTIADTATAGSELTVTLNADSSGDPGSVLCTLTDPASFSASGLHTFTAATSGAGVCQTLAPNTDYFVVIERANNNTHTISLSFTRSLLEDTISPATGWTVGDLRHRYQVSWVSNGGAHIIDVQGTVCVGPTGPYARDACRDFDTLLAASNTDPRGIWSNGTTVWVADVNDNKLYAYRMSDRTRDSAKDIPLHSDNTNPRGIWSDGTTMWVADVSDNKLYAYQMSDKSRDLGKDFTLDADNTFASGIWSDETTMWVADTNDSKIYAYQMSDRTPDSGKDFDTLSGAGNIDPTGIWSDGTTMWVSDTVDNKLYAYEMSDQTHNSGKEFNTLSAAGNNQPRSIWSDGTAMWVSDPVDNKLYAYQMLPPNTPAQGAPDIVGIPAVLHELTADITGISDADGLHNVSYSYQWIRVDGGSETNVGTDSSTYTLVDDDEGKNIKVTVSFTDDGSNQESLTSQEVGPVVAVDPTPGVLVKNTGQSIYSIDQPLNNQREAWAQVFYTGSDATFYKVDSIGIRFATIHGSSNPASELTVTLHRGRAVPAFTPNDEILCTLTNPDTFTGDAVNTFHPPMSGDPCPLLEPETKYAVVVKRANANTHEITLSVTRSEDEDILNPPTGWTIFHSPHYFRESIGRWSSSPARPLMMEVKGKSIVPKLTSAIPSLTVVSQGWNIAQVNVTVASPGTVSIRWRPESEPNFGEDQFTVEPDENNEAALLLLGFTRGVAYVVQASQDGSFSDPAEVVFLHEWFTNVRDIQAIEVSYTTAVVEVTHVPFENDWYYWVSWTKADRSVAWQNQTVYVDADASTATTALSSLAMGTTYILDAYGGNNWFYRFPRASFTTLVSVTFSRDSMTVNEGSSDTYTVVLDTQPTADVTIDITAGGDVTTDLTSVTFTQSTWNIPQTITVSAAEDDDDDDDFETITHTVASGSAAEYALANLPDVEVQVPELGVTLSPTSLTIDEGESATHTVVLNKEPTANVLIDIGYVGDVTASPDRLVFTPSNWDSAQTVTVRAAHDDDGIDDIVVVVHGIAPDSVAVEYFVASLDSMRVTVRDDEIPAPMVRHFRGANESQTAIPVIWWAERHAHEYKLEYRKGGTTDAWTRITRGDFDHVPSTSSNRLLVGIATGLECNTAHDFRISMRGDGQPMAEGFGPYAETSHRTGECARTDRPTNLLTTVTPECAILSWTAPTGDDYTGVRVRRLELHEHNYTTIHESLNSAPTSYRDCRNSGDGYGDGDRPSYNYRIYYIKSDGAGGATKSEYAQTGFGEYGPSEVPWVQPPRNVRLTRDTDSQRRMAWEAPPSLDSTISAGLQGRSLPTRDPWITGYVVERREFRVRGGDDFYLPRHEDVTVWDATLTVGQDSNALQKGFDPAALGALIPSTFGHSSGTQTVSVLFIIDTSPQSLHLNLRPRVTEPAGLKSKWTLLLDGEEFPFSDAEVTNIVQNPFEQYVWRDTDLSWNNGQTVDVKIVERRPLGWEVMREGNDGNTSTSYTDNEDANGRKFVYRIMTTNALGPSDELYIFDWLWDSPHRDAVIALAATDTTGDESAENSGNTGGDQTNSPATGAPTISDAAQVGETLTAGTSDISDSDGLTSVSYSYQWLAGGSDVDGATGSTYEVSDDDVGKTIKVRVSFTDDAGNQETLTSAATVVVTARPNSPATGQPAISGTAQAEETLTANTSGIADADGLTNVSYSYQWLADDADIEDATGSTYVVSDADVGKTLKVRVSFIDDANNEETMTSAPTAAVAPSGDTEAPLWSADMTVVETSRTLGALRANLFSNVGGSGNLEIKRLWSFKPRRNLLLAFEEGVPNAADYTLEVGDLSLEFPEGSSGNSSFSWNDVDVDWEGGQVVHVRIVPTPESDAQQTNTPATGEPTIDGTAQVGRTLTADITAIADADGLDNAAFAYQWIASNENRDIYIQDAIDSTYVVSDDDVGKTVKVRVSFTDDANNQESLTSADTAAVTARPNSPATGAPAIDGTAQAGQTLTAVTSAISDTEGLTNVSYSYQWLADDADIEDATDSTYVVSNDDVGKTIKVRVSFTDNALNEESLTSAATTAVVATEPTEPLGLTVSEGSQDLELDASWQVPSSNGGSAITGYKVQWKEATGRWDSATDVSEGTVTGTSHTITGLTGGVEYAVRVIATNDVGDSPASSEATGAPAGGVSQQDAEPENNAATGLPTISGTAQAGETLTADITAIADPDGLANVSYSYQWIRNDGTADADIGGETGSTYVVSNDDVDKTIKVRVSFTDDANNEETLTSAATGEVTAAVAEAADPLTVTLENDPASHDGSADFTFEIRFSEHIADLSYKTLRDHAFTVTGGQVKKAQRMDPASETRNIAWRITVRPDSNGDVTIVLPVTTDCGAQGAICTEDDRKLSNRLEFTVSGPG